jgi:hypothetical protein
MFMSATHDLSQRQIEAGPGLSEWVKGMHVLRHAAIGRRARDGLTPTFKTSSSV